MIRAGEVSDFFYVCESGSLVVSVEGRTVELCEPLAQDGWYPSFGEKSLLFNQQCTADVSAITPGVKPTPYLPCA